MSKTSKAVLLLPYTPYDMHSDNFLYKLNWAFVQGNYPSSLIIFVSNSDIENS